VGNGRTASPSDSGAEHGEPLPVAITALGNEVAEIATGEYHTCARKTDGTVWCWGDNAYGELGDGTTVMRSSPVRVTALGSSVTEVVAGRAHTCARKADGSLWCWGENQYGQLGDGTTVNRAAPVSVFGADALRIAAGGYGTCAEKSDGSLWCWGDNSAGLLDNGSSKEICTVQVFVPPDPFGGGGGGYVTEQFACHKSPTLIDGVCEAVPDFGGPLVINACTSTNDGGLGSAWPPSPTSSTAACTPNCGADTCASSCQVIETGTDPYGVPYAIPTPTGMPCDSGCCSANKAQTSNFGTSGGGPGLGAVAAAPSGRLYYGTSMGWGNLGDFTYARTDDSGATWVGMQTIPADESGDVMWVGMIAPDFAQTNPTFSNPIAFAVDPQFAFGGSGAAASVYMAYGLASPEPFGGPIFPGALTRARIGVGEPPQSQTWEDLPTANGALAADGSGALWLSGNKVFRRTAKRTWDATCLPDPGGPGIAMALDDSGAWYVARNGGDGNVYVSRHTPDGAWSTEMVATGTATAIAFGGGTVHVTYLRNGDVYYARRVGTAWTENLAVIATTLPANVVGEHVYVTFAYLRVDSCGSPHIGVYAENGMDSFNTYYVRWTPSGWVSATFWSTNDPQYSGGIALTSTHALLPFDSGGWEVLSIPLK
jgi:hypothetical protein